MNFIFSFQLFSVKTFNPNLFICRIFTINLELSYLGPYIIKTDYTSGVTTYSLDPV